MVKKTIRNDRLRHRLAAWSKATLAAATLALSLGAAAVPLELDWDQLTWLPEGNTNLTQTYNVAGRDIVVTFGGNTAGLDSIGPTLSPRLSSTGNTGGLLPPELSLVVGTDYPPNDPNPQVTVTLDFSDYPGGVNNLSFSIFDIDFNTSFTDNVSVTAIAGGVQVNPTTILPGPFNILLNANTVEGRTLAAPTSAEANARFEFAQSEITQITVVYSNTTANLQNPGLQIINIHDMAYNFGSADISVDKSVDNPTPGITDTVTFSVVVTNGGPDPATALQVTDQLPAGLTYLSDDSGGSYDPGTGLWDVGALAVGASATLLIDAQVNATGPYDNTAELTAAGELDPDSTPGNNDPTEDDQSTVTIVPTEFADLSLTKLVDDAEPLPGDTITFTLQVTNGGPVAATGVQVGDPLPDGFQYLGDVPSQGTYDAATGTWDVGGLAVGASATLQVTVQVLTRGNYVNVAEVTASDQSDPDSTPGNNVPGEDDQASVVVVPVAIGVAKSVSAGPFNNGDGTYTLLYSVTVTNFGTGDLGNLQVVDDLAATFAGAVGFVVDTVVSGDFTVNPGYDGVGDTNLLTGADTLNAGASGFIAIGVTLTPGANLGPYLNVSIGSATGPNGTPVTDPSQSGVDPDPDGDGDPTNNNDPTPVTIGEAPQIGLAKRVNGPVANNGDGSFTLTYTLLAENTGDVVLVDVQILDNLATTFAAAESVQVDSVVSGDLAVNPAYDGDVDTRVLAGTDSLAVGASGSVNVTITVRPGAFAGPYENSATGSGVSPGGTPVSDTSTDGASTDPDNDGDPGNNSDPTPVTFVTQPQIGVAKRVSAGPVNNGDGTFTASYDILVTNSGDVLLSAIRITDDLTATFAAAVSFSIDALTSADFAVNPNYDGGADLELLDGSDTLAVGDSGVVTVTVTIEPGANSGPYNNLATGYGTTPSGDDVQDVSTDGVQPDANNNGDPGDDDTPTPLTLVANPGLGVAKRVTTTPMDNNNGTYTFSYTMLVANTGDVVLTDLQLVDNLNATFGGSLGFVVNAVQSADFAVNPGFDGATDTNLLAGSDTLAVGADGELTVTMTVTPGGFAGPYLNTATGTGVPPSGVPVSDDSTDGTDVDPDGDGNPGNNSEPTPVSFATTLIVVTKSAQPRQVSVGDLVRYTVTVENQGGGGFVDLTMNDLIPPGFTYVDDSLRVSGDDTTSVAGERPLLISGIDLFPGQMVTLTYMLRVGAGVAAGPYVNIATPFSGNTPVGDPATATVEVVADPDFEQTTIIGKVFADHNRDGYQDPDEFGIPGVRLATVEGLLIETDQHGRYHIAGVDGGFMERGRNFIVKVDAATLPDGAQFTTENPRVKRITQGLMNRFDFGVALPADNAKRLYPINVKLAEVFFEENSDVVRPEFEDAFAQIAERLRAQCGGKLLIEGNDPPRCMVQSPDTLATAVQSETFIMVPHFGIRQATLTAEDRAALEGLVERWRDARDVSLTSIGHTSSVRIAPENVAEFADNYVLGQARAQTVADYLATTLGIDSSRITIESRGPDEPVGDNSTREGRAQNRRVELTLKGRRTSQETIPGLSVACDPNLAERRARAVSAKLVQYLGAEMVCDVEVVVDYK